MTGNDALLAAVAEVYAWIDEQTAAWPIACRACGRCCDFDQYDHRLFLTSPELIFFRRMIPAEILTPMTNGSCPCLSAGRCSVHPMRFAGCGIFCCSAPTEAQCRLSEQAIARFKEICESFGLPYAYVDLKTALNTPAQR